MFQKNDSRHATDLYVSINFTGINGDVETFSISYPDNSKWNQEFHFELNSNNVQIDVLLKDKSRLNHQLISMREIQLALYEPGKVHDVWLRTYPSANCSSDIFPKIHFIIHLSQKGEKPFTENFVSSRRNSVSLK